MEATTHDVSSLRAPDDTLDAEPDDVADGETIVWNTTADHCNLSLRRLEEYGLATAIRDQLGLGADQDVEHSGQLVDLYLAERAAGDTRDIVSKIETVADTSLIVGIDCFTGGCNCWQDAFEAATARLDRLLRREDACTTWVTLDPDGNAEGVADISSYRHLLYVAREQLHSFDVRIAMPPEHPPTMHARLFYAHSVQEVIRAVQLPTARTDL